MVNTCPSGEISVCMSIDKKVSVDKLPVGAMSVSVITSFGRNQRPWVHN